MKISNDFNDLSKEQKEHAEPPLLSMISMTYTDGTERGDLLANHLFFFLLDLKPKRHKDSIFLNDFKDLGVDLNVVERNYSSDA